jgi:cytoskeleton protein RodZ
MSDAADTLGERLKAARQAKGLGVQKAADELHLDAWVIDGLESGDYARIGPPVYIKGHLKRYAGLIGLSPADILDAYAARPAAPAAVAALPETPPLRTSGLGREELRWVPLAGLAAAALVLAGVYWWTTWRPHMAAFPNNGRAPAAPSAEDGVLPALANAEESAADRSVEAGAGGALTAMAPTGAVAGAAGEPDAVAGAGPARLRLSFSADSWVDVRDATGRRLYAGNGRANSVKTIAGNAPMKVYLGFASGVQLEVNHHAVAIGPQFVAGDVARFEAGADGVLRRDTRTTTVSNPHPRG